jgi:hypothetical protein
MAITAFDCRSERLQKASNLHNRVRPYTRIATHSAIKNKQVSEFLARRQNSSALWMNKPNGLSTIPTGQPTHFAALSAEPIAIAVRPIALSVMPI